MPGFKVVEARMEKVGIRGTATARLAFRDMFVPKENILGEIGKGLRLALTVLDFGRTTFGATCTGAARFCLERSIDYANSRRQFGKTIGEFDLIREKIAHMAADTFAMESATYHTAALIDSGAEDYMLETSMLKVFASDTLWRIVNDALQIHGGAGFFTDLPFERMMRDARLNLIGEGANEVLRCFNAAVGLRSLGKELETIRKRPWKAGKLLRLAPTIPVSDGLLQPAAHALAMQIASFSRACQRALIRYREGIVDHELVLARLGDVATELFFSSCVYARLCGIVSRGDADHETRQRLINTGLLCMKSAQRRNRMRLAELNQNDDAAVSGVSTAWLQSRRTSID
jgi:alkylation response protein AidB-like acyl-CoA dehydrogenase